MPKRPPISRSLVIKFLESKGFVLESVKGSHHKFNKLPSLVRPLILTLEDPIPFSHVKQALESIGVDLSDFMNILLPKKVRKSKSRKNEC